MIKLPEELKKVMDLAIVISVVCAWGLVTLYFIYLIIHDIDRIISNVLDLFVAIIGLIMFMGMMWLGINLVNLKYSEYKETGESHG